MSEPETEAPATLTPEQSNRLLVIPFNATIPANTSQTIVAGQISHRYYVSKIDAHFTDDSVNNVQVRVYVSDSASAPTVNPPTGTNITGKYGNTPYLTGNGEVVSLDCAYIPSFYETWLKVYFTNNNAYQVNCSVYVTIRSITEQEAQKLLSGDVIDIRTKESEEYTEEIISKTKATYEAIDETLKGTYPRLRTPINELKDSSNNWLGQNQQQYANLSNIVNSIPVDTPLEDRHKFTKAWVDGAIETTKNLEFMDGLISGITGAIGVSVPQWSTFLEEIFGIKQQTAKILSIAFEKGALKPVEYYWNKMYAPEYPQVSELINMVVKEQLPVKDFQEIMTYHGYSSFWSQKIWDAHYQQPDFSTVRQAYFRGGILPEELDHYLALVDLDPRYNDKVWKTLLSELPSYQELTNMRVKEIITQETYDEYLQKLGYQKEWGQRIWDAHFQPANFNDFLTAYRRNMNVSIPKAEGAPEPYQFGTDSASDIEKIKELSILADYDSRYWDFFKTRIYNDPTPRQARWGYEAGVLDEQQVYDICLRSGFAPSDASWFANFSMSFQERPFITKYLSALQTAYFEKAITAEELTARVEAIPRRKEIADWIIKIADVRTEIETSKTSSISKVSFSDLKTLYARGNKTDYDVLEWYKAKGYSNEDAIIMGQILKEAPEATEPEKTLSVSELKQMYIMSIISEDEFRTRMQLRGFQVLDVDNLITLYAKIREEKESGSQKHALSVSEMLNAFKYWQISEDELRVNLMQRGLNLQEAQLLIDTNKKKWKSSSAGWTETEPIQEGD